MIITRKMVIQGAVLDALPALYHALDPELAHGCIARLLAADQKAAGWRCVPHYVRFKAESGCLVGHRLVREDGSDSSTFRWVTLFALPPARARALFDKLSTLSPRDDADLRALAIDQDLGLVLLTFPNDRVLRGLKRLLQTGTLKRTVGSALPVALLGDGTLGGRGSDFSVVRYKPERRCVVRYAAVVKRPTEGDRLPLDLYLRVLVPRLLETLVPTRMAIEAHAPHDLRVPRLLGYDEQFSMLVEEDLGLPAAPASLPLEQVGHTLALLHQIEIPQPLRDREERVLHRIHQAAADLARLDESLGQHAEQVLARLIGTEPPRDRSVLLHGDFSASQVWTSRGAVALLDLDRVRPGRREEDLAWWSAQEQIESLCRDAGETSDSSASLPLLLAGYRPTAGAIDESSLSWFRAAALLELAMTPFRKLDPAYLEKAHHILDTATRLVGNASESRLPLLPTLPSFLAELKRLLHEPVTSLDHRGLSRLRKEDGVAFLYRTSADTPVAMMRGEEPRFGVPLLSVPFTLIDPRRDPALPGLRALLGMESHAQLEKLGLSTDARVRLISYRPTRRAALRIEAGDGIAFVKAYDRSRFAQVLTRELAIAEASARAATTLSPQVTGYDPETGLLAYSRAPGESLHDQIRRGAAIDLSTVARAVQRLHALPVAGLPAHGAKEELDAVGKAIELCRHEHAERADALEALARTVEPIAARGTAVLHRDLHDKQVFIAGTSVTFIDLETAARGDRELDIANLAEHLMLRGMQKHELALGERLADGWHSLFPEADPTRLRFYQACTLIRLCAVYALRRAEPALVQALFERAQSFVRGAHSLLRGARAPWRGEQ